MAKGMKAICKNVVSGQQHLKLLLPGQVAPQTAIAVLEVRVCKLCVSVMCMCVRARMFMCMCILWAYCAWEHEKVESNASNWEWSPFYSSSKVGFCIIYVRPVVSTAIRHN